MRCATCEAEALVCGTCINIGNDALKRTAARFIDRNEQALKRIEPLAKYAKETIEKTVQPESFWQDILDTYNILKGPG